jgi:hypothetical protein
VLICIAAAMAVIGIVFFLLTEDMDMPMEFVDMETIPQTVIFIIGLIASILLPRLNKDDDDDGGTQTYTHTEF